MAIRTQNILSAALAGLVALSVPVASQAQMADHPQDQTLRAGAEVGFAPFNFRKADGSIDGYSFDISTELAKRLGRPGLEVVDIVFANIFASMHAKRIEYVMAPTTITATRAAELLFTEPYFDVGLGFLTRQDNRFASMDDLKGKTVGVTSGSVQDEWMKNNAEKHGVIVQRFDKTADAIQAVGIRRIDAYMSTTASAQWTVKQQPNFAIDVSVLTGGQFGLPTRPGDTEFRDLLESHLECMKLDGTAAKIHEKWFGVVPAPGSSMVTVYEGFGAPGWPGHDPAGKRTVACG